MRSIFKAKVVAMAGIILLAVGGFGYSRTTAPSRALHGVHGRRIPVLVELFTSEGCSSCPPADIVLANLQKEQPVENGEVIALSEHVDYWNHLGWADPFSSRGFSDRQREYGRAFRLDSVYTPQMVVNGQAEFVGSDQDRAEAMIARAAHMPHADIQITSGTDGDIPTHLQVSVGNLPANRSGGPVDVVLAITENNLQSNVARGENAGRQLRHTAVVRQMRFLGTLTPGHAFNATPALKLESAWKRKDLGAVVFAQERNSRHVLGAAEVSLK